MIKINTFSKLVSLSIRTLRYYDEIGLLKPFYVDEKTKYRYYVARQIKTANQITQLKEMGFSLKEINGLILETDLNTIKRYLKRQQARLDNEMSKIEYKKMLIDKFLSNTIEKEDLNYINYHVIKKTIPKRKVISVKGVVHLTMMKSYYGISYRKL